MFQTKYNRKDRVPSEAGSTELVTPVYNENYQIVDYAVTNLDALIQSNADNGNVKLILDRFQVTGDDSYLNVNEGFYGDITNSQDLTIHDMHYNHQAAVDLYESMPESVRELYPTVNDFYDNFNDDQITSLFNPVEQSDVIENGGDNIIES